jgi:hypothetical protein
MIMSTFNYVEVHDDYHECVDCCATVPERSWVSIFVVNPDPIKTSVNSERDSQSTHHANQNALNPELIEVEATISQANLVDLIVGQKDLLFEFSVHNTVPHDREGCKDDVVQLVDPTLIQSLTTEGRHEPEPELGHHEGNVLVKHVDYCK